MEESLYKKVNFTSCCGLITLCLPKFLTFFTFHVHIWQCPESVIKSVIKSFEKLLSDVFLEKPKILFLLENTVKHGLQLLSTLWIVSYWWSHLWTKFCPWLVWLSWLSATLWTKGSPVQFPARAHAWVAGQIPCEGHVGGSHTLMFLSLSFSPTSPL